MWPFLGPSTARDSAALGATYLGTFTLIDGVAPAYIVADRSVSYAADGAPAASAATDAYLDRREQYLARRKTLCESTPPGGDRLKASPLGDVIERLPQT